MDTDSDKLVRKIVNRFAFVAVVAYVFGFGMGLLGGYLCFNKAPLPHGMYVVCDNGDIFGTKGTVPNVARNDSFSIGPIPYMRLPRYREH